MSKKTPALRPFTIPDELRGDESLKAGRAFVDSVHRAGALAERALFAGVFSIDDPSKLSAAIEAIGMQDGDLKALRNKVERLVTAVRKGELTAAQSAALSELDDLTYELGLEWGEAGYVLGLAMGQRVGMGAFRTGGAR
jgi:hypothetical protein